MYYTTSGSYRKTKMIIDYANIGLTVVVGFLFIMILFLRSRSGLLFPLIFLTGGVINALNSIKNFMAKRRIAGGVLAVVALALFVMSAWCWFVTA